MAFTWKPRIRQVASFRDPYIRKAPEIAGTVEPQSISGEGLCGTIPTIDRHGRLLCISCLVLAWLVEYEVLVV